MDIAKHLEDVALNDEYFIKRKLYPNVDFYSGILYRAMGIPTNMFTVMFSLGRLPGWIAHWKELRASDTCDCGFSLRRCKGLPSSVTHDDTIIVPLPPQRTRDPDGYVNDPNPQSGIL